MDPRTDAAHLLTRRALLGRGAGWLGAAALAELMGCATPGARAGVATNAPPVPRGPHFPPRAKAVIYLFLSEGPSQLDLWDHKPGLEAFYDQELPDSVRQGQRLTGMTSGQKRLPIAPTRFRFRRHGDTGTFVSELLPHTAQVVDRLCLIHSMWTESINHDPGITYLCTGSELPGRPSFGSWLSYGLGADSRDLPAFVVMTPSWTGRKEAQALFSRLWGSGFLPSQHQGVSLRSQGDPVLYLNDPPGIDRADRRAMLDALAALNARTTAAVGDPETAARVLQYEMAFRMQASVPELLQLQQEPDHVLALYGPEVRTPGSFAASALLARRMVERGVRCVQLFHRGWDQHFNVAGDLPNQCRDTDQPIAGLILDLEQRGMLDDTLIVCTGEFGRTVYSQGDLTRDNYGRD